MDTSAWYSKTSLFDVKFCALELSSTEAWPGAAARGATQSTREADFQMPNTTWTPRAATERNLQNR